MTLKPELIQRVLRFGVVGIVVMLFFVCLNWLFGHWLGPWTANLISYPPAWALHYVLSKWWTFNCTRKDTGRQISDYLVMLTVTFVVQNGFFWLAHEQFGLVGWLASGVASIAQMAVSFLMMQRRVFAAARV